MPLTPGDRLGPYEILNSIGAGGMGEVWKARDTRLDRLVAIKILSASLAANPDALARFEREALSVAKLSHPNILAIYEFGNPSTSSGQGTSPAYVVTELVDGETLRARLQQGPLSARRAVAYALQIARGIAAAHARGIVHRDLKPENVMIARDDRVTILDFGLAKPIGVNDVDAGETRAVSVRTSAGTVLGTFAYMAPEQVRGLAVDHRADIFAFGAVLYEMLSGERAFKGETAADTMTAILTKDPPDLDVARLNISPGLDRIVRRCVEKSPELRFQSADDLAFALETLSTSSSAPGSAHVDAPAASRRRVMTVLPWAIAAIAILGITGITLRGGSAGSDGVWQRFIQLTDAAGEETAPAISPDGGTVVYVMRKNGRSGLYSQRFGGRNATPIVVDPDRDYGGPAFSPDGSSIAFHASGGHEGGIFVAGATGETVHRLTDSGFDPSWSPDGKQIAYATEEALDPESRLSISSLWTVDAGGGTPHRISNSDGMQPVFSPSGKRIVFWANINGQRDLYTMPVGGGAPAALTSDPALDWSPIWSPDGRYVYFSSDRGGAMNLWRIAVDESSGAAKGQPEPVTNGVQASASLPRFSKTGSRLVFRSRVKAINPVAIPFDPATAKAGVPVVLDGSNNYRIPSDVSPDGSQLALFNIGESQEDIFLASVDGSHVRRLTDDEPRDRSPMFTRDGRAVIFYSRRGGDWSVWTIRTDGSGLRQLYTVPGGLLYPSVSPISDDIAFSDVSTRASYRGTLSGAPLEKLPNTQAPDGDKLLPMGWSPDGRQLSGCLFQANGTFTGVAVYALATHAMTVLSDEPCAAARWLPDNRHVLYFTANGEALTMVDAVTKQRTRIDVRLPGRSVNDMFAVSRDGRTIYYGAVRSEADIWIAERK
jgi:eukaryotic-like serine/threonine-protein kinase